MADTLAEPVGVIRWIIDGSDVLWKDLGDPVRPQSPQVSDAGRTLP